MGASDMTPEQRRKLKDNARAKNVNVKCEVNAKCCKSVKRVHCKSEPCTRPTAKMLEGMRQDFHTVDENRSGFIRGSELAALLTRQLGRAPTETEIEASLREHDLDRDGQISFDEYVQWLWPASIPCTSGG